MYKIPLLLAVLLAGQVHAGGQWCHGTINNSYIDHSGSVYIIGSWRGDHTKVCNLNTSWKNISTSTCKTWVGYIQLALASKAPVVMHYADVNSCSSIGRYGSAEKPSYIMIKEK